MPALDAPAFSHEVQQRIWGGAQACDEPMRSRERFVGMDAGGDYFCAPAGAVPLGLCSSRQPRRIWLWPLLRFGFIATV